MEEGFNRMCKKKAFPSQYLSEKKADLCLQFSSLERDLKKPGVAEFHKVWV